RSLRRRIHLGFGPGAVLASTALPLLRGFLRMLHKHLTLLSMLHGSRIRSVSSVTPGANRSRLDFAHRSPGKEEVYEHSQVRDGQDEALRDSRAVPGTARRAGGGAGTRTRGHG